MTLLRFDGANPDTPPLDPTAAHARQQLLDELSKPRYQAARPSVVDLAGTKIENWLNHLLAQLFGGAPSGGTALVVVVLVIILIAAVVVGLLVFGLPRRGRRSRGERSLFGEDDDRDAAALLRSAEAAAAAGDFTTAVEEGFRSIARTLAERAVVTTFPGTTARGFAVSAATAFPTLASRLGDCADAFDAVRYLGRSGTAAQWSAVSELERALRQSRPVMVDDRRPFAGTDA